MVNKSKFKFMTSNTFYITLFIFLTTVVWNGGKIYNKILDNTEEIQKINSKLDKFYDFFTDENMDYMDRQQLKKK